VRFHHLQRAQLLAGTMDEQERECSVSEVRVLRGKDGQELVDRDTELQIPPRHEELQLVLLLPAHLPLHYPEVARHRSSQ